LDFHTGGASRFNVPQTRVANTDSENMKLAEVFNAPFILLSKNLDKTYRSASTKLGKNALLYEGGKSQSNNKDVAKEGVNGSIRVLKYLEMLPANFNVDEVLAPSVLIEKSSWLRAKYSGLLHLEIECGTYVEKGEQLATITENN